MNVIFGPSVTPFFRGRSPTGFALAIFACLATLLLWVGSAHAQGTKPVKGIHFIVLDESDPKVTLIRILPDVNIHTPSLAEIFGTTMFQIREDNRQNTIALCHRKNGRFDMGVVKTDKDRAKDTIWDSCPDEKEQYVYVLPGQTIRMTHDRSLLRSQKVDLVDQAWKCPDAQCALDVFGKFGKEFAGAVAPTRDKQPTEVAPPPVPPETRKALALQAALDACRGDAACADQALLAAGVVKPPVVWQDALRRWGLVGVLAALFLLALVDSVRQRLTHRTGPAAATADEAVRSHEMTENVLVRQMLRKNEELAAYEQRIAELEREQSGLAAEIKSQADILQTKDENLKAQRERNNDLENQLQQLRLDKAGLQEALDVYQRSGPPSSIPSPAVHMRPQTRTETVPWLGGPPVPVAAPSEPFFDELQNLLAFGTRLVVDTPSKFFLLLDLLQSKVDIRLNRLFPDGPPNSLAAHKWDRLVADYQDVILGQARFAFVMDELGLPRPSDYRKPRVLSGG